MAQDDLVPDEVLVRRLEQMLDAVRGVAEVVLVRKHLREAHLHLTGAVSSIDSALDMVREKAQPDDEINAKYRSRMRKECFPTYSGVWFYPFDPKAEEVRHQDIVMGLMHTSRFNGQSNRAESVAEHSIKVAAVVEHLVAQEVAEGNLRDDIVPLACAYAMLHDAPEALTGAGDIIGPVKHRVHDEYGTSWTRIEDGVMEVVIEAYQLPPLPAEIEAIVKQADASVLYCEALALKPDSDLDRWNLRVPSGAEVSIGRIAQAEPDRAKVRDLFDREVRRLVSLIGGRIPEGKPLPGQRAYVHAKDDPQVARKLAAEQFAKAVGEVVPGDRPNPPPPPEAQEIITPALGRDPREHDVTDASWKDAIRSTATPVPPELRDEPELKEMTAANVAAWKKSVNNAPMEGSDE